MSRVKTKELTKSEKIHMHITFSIFHRNNDFIITGINFSRCFNPTRIEWDGAIIETHDLKLKLENNNNIKMVDTPTTGVYYTKTLQEWMRNSIQLLSIYPHK